MAKNCSANYVDRLLMKFDGAICPIWISAFFTVEQLPATDILFSCVNLLFDDIPRLRSIWSHQQRGWVVIEPNAQQRIEAYQFDNAPKDKNERIQSLIKKPINLEQSLPFFLSVGRIHPNENRWLIGFQLHHAAGDGSALIHSVKQYWGLLTQALENRQRPLEPLAPPQMTDKKILYHCLENKKNLPYLLNSKYRQLSRRADALSHQATKIGDPCLNSLKINITHLQKYNSSELFYAAILAAIVRSEPNAEDKLIRFRMPIDLRVLWGIAGNSVENGCAAVILELSLSQIKQTYSTNPKRLGFLLRKSLITSLKKRMYLCNALECLMISHLSSAKTLKKAAQEEILASKRSSTMVITHLGDVTGSLKPPSPINVLNIESHTPVWGANSFVYDGFLHLNVTCFDGIWNQEQRKRFITDAKNWLISQYDLSGALS